MKTIFLMIGWCAATAIVNPLCTVDAAPPAAKIQNAFKNVSVADAEKLTKNTNVIVMDVRTPKEFKEGRIHGATNVNFYDKSFSKQLGTLDKTRPYLVHCAVGGRSGKAVKTMQELGFTDIYHLEAGMKGWEKAGKPVEK